MVGSRIRHQISTSHMCFRADGHISVSERPQTRDFAVSTLALLVLYIAISIGIATSKCQFSAPAAPKISTLRVHSALPTTVTHPKFPVKIPMTILPYTKFRDSTTELADTPEGECPPPLRRAGEIVRLDQSLGSTWGLDWKPASNEWPAAPPLLRRALHAFYARVRIRRLGG